jgi:hypothetical protein
MKVQKMLERQRESGIYHKRNSVTMSSVDSDQLIETLCQIESNNNLLFQEDEIIYNQLLG